MREAKITPTSAIAARPTIARLPGFPPDRSSKKPPFGRPLGVADGVPPTTVAPVLVPPANVAVTTPGVLDTPSPTTVGPTVGEGKPPEQPPA